MRAALLISLLLFFVNAKASCKVIDPELQGRYTGGCVDGLAHGRGRAEGAALYDGEFRAGSKHGTGTKIWPNGDRYEGGWDGDRKHGRGVYTWGPGKWEGERYEGEFSNDRRHGQGVYTWPKGDRFVGTFDNDRMVGGTATPVLAARLNFEREVRAAVGKEGQVVCRDMAGGGWERGTVAQVKEETVAVRLASGALVEAPFREWTPCY